MRKLLLVIATVACLCAALAQDASQNPAPMNMAPPPEMDKVSWMVGDWTGDYSFTMNGNTGTGTSTISTTKSLGDRWIESKELVKMDTMDVEGRMLLTYDTVVKTYRAYWFDSMSGVCVDMSGDLAGDTITMTSKPTPMESADKLVVMKMECTKTDNDHFTTTLSQQDGDKWVTMMVMKYTRKAA